MPPRALLVPTLLNRPATACPRCDAPRIAVLDADTAFDWRECKDCGYLWALPHGWTPQGQ